MFPPRLLALLFLVLALQNPFAAQESDPPSNDQNEEMAAESDAEPDEHINESDESEDTGIIPPGAAIQLSSGPVTPLSSYVEQDDYKAGLASLAQAEALWKKGDVESASDLALQAYDDLMSVPLPRIRKKSKNKAALQKKRDQIRADRRRAATVYVNSSIDYVKTYAKKSGNRKDARSRLNDLRDVAINYTDLNRLLYKAMDEMR